MLLEKEADRSHTSKVIKLMSCVIRSGAQAYALLDRLYVELKINTGFFRGYRMAPSIDQQTRDELVGYITALVAILVQSEFVRAEEAQSTVAALEELVFEPEWYMARPVYQRYLARFQHSSSGQSPTSPRHKVLLILFRQTLIDIWKVPDELFTEYGTVQRYCEALTALQEDLEYNIRETIDKCR